MAPPPKLAYPSTRIPTRIQSKIPKMEVNASLFTHSRTHAHQHLFRPLLLRARGCGWDELTLIPPSKRWANPRDVHVSAQTRPFPPAFICFLIPRISVLRRITGRYGSISSHTAAPQLLVVQVAFLGEMPVHLSLEFSP